MSKPLTVFASSSVTREENKKRHVITLSSAENDGILHVQVTEGLMVTKTLIIHSVQSSCRSLENNGPFYDGDKLAIDASLVL